MEFNNKLMLWIENNNSKYHLIRYKNSYVTPLIDIIDTNTPRFSLDIAWYDKTSHSFIDPITKKKYKIIHHI